ncbi:MAG: glycine--tRNA ligase subunit beta [Desulfovibrio sp.]|nr:glycine--tRNA ligase subunit beta [Desulfovibrio sp.]
MSTFVLEIGSEELPSRFLPVERVELKERFTQALDENMLAHGGIRVFTTPRRATVIIDDIAAVQSEKEEVVSGPPVRVAYADDKPTKALEGFARTQGVSLADVFTLKTDKGEYVAVKKKTGGVAAGKLLEAICPAVITALPFAKRMRWGAYSLAYARPLHWVLALLDGEVVPFSVGPVSSGRETYGHRVHGRGPFAVADAAAYAGVVREKCGVMLDQAERRAMIVREGDRLAAAAGGKIIWNDALLEEVEGLVEHPLPLLGNFDPSYLEVPQEVLLTSMESHQKSFGVIGDDGSLKPHFLTVSNITPDDVEVVRQGWERVLHARLEDARFFWRADLRENFDAWLKKLDSVIFIGGLGTMGDKTRRLEQLCRWLAERCRPGDSVLAADAARAGLLSKADLVTGLVGEFDTLQGIMGGIYAGRKNETAAVSLALKEQYLPAGPDTPVPSTIVGAILSVADKADTLVGCFGLDRIPTGAADPNGLRRCALGIIRILTDFKLGVNVRELFARALELYGKREWKLDSEAALNKLTEFFAGRLNHHLQAAGHNVLSVDAVLRVGVNDVPDALMRLAALEDFLKSADYAASALTLKRVSNISQKQAKAEAIPAQWSTSLLAEAAEKKFSDVLLALLPELDRDLTARRYADVLAALKKVRPEVDAFFDSVMVMCEEPEVRRNRLAMLCSLAARFSVLADFSVLQI